MSECGESQKEGLVPGTATGFLLWRPKIGSAINTRWPDSTFNLFRLSNIRDVPF